jgi:hypothetical protein
MRIDIVEHPLEPPFRQLRHATHADVGGTRLKRRKAADDRGPLTVGLDWSEHLAELLGRQQVNAEPFYDRVAAAALGQQTVVAAWDRIHTFRNQFVRS